MNRIGAQSRTQTIPPTQHHFPMVPPLDPLGDDCNACLPEYMRRQSPTQIAISALPFISTFLIVAAVASRKLFPILSNDLDRKSQHAPLVRDARPTAKIFANVIFSINFGLSAVLAELILCEITNTAHRTIRISGLKITLPLLLFLLIIVTPALEIHSVVAKTSFTDGRTQGRRRTAGLLHVLGMGIWLAGFWYLGRGLRGSYLHEESYVHNHTFIEGCLERIGIIGISLMASLAGFAAVSSLWQTFKVKYRKVTDSDIERKEAGIQASNDMLLTKEIKLRAIERRLSEQTQQGFLGRVVGTIRGNPDVQERNTLQLEIQGLETMRQSLQSSLSILQNRQKTQQRSRTVCGCLFHAITYGFAIYCAYRIIATTLTTLRRFSAPNTRFSNSDPINNFLTLLAKHWDPTIDREAWSRTISFLFSGVMLLLPFNSVLQTFLLFARVTPSLLQHTKSNFALMISQTAAIYVVSSALLLRSNLPTELQSKIGDALGAPLEPTFTEMWFEAWFLTSSAATTIALWLGKRLKGTDWDDDEIVIEKNMESGKIS